MLAIRPNCHFISFFLSVPLFNSAIVPVIVFLHLGHNIMQHNILILTWPFNFPQLKVNVLPCITWCIKNILYPQHSFLTEYWLKLIFIAKFWTEKSRGNIKENYRTKRLCAVTSLWYSLFESIATLRADEWCLADSSRSVLRAGPLSFGTTGTFPLSPSRSQYHLSSSSFSQKTALALLLQQFDEALPQVVEVKQFEVEDLDSPLDLIVSAVSILQCGGQALLGVLHPPLQVHVTPLQLLNSITCHVTQVSNSFLFSTQLNVISSEQISSVKLNIITLLIDVHATFVHASTSNLKWSSNL